MDSLLNVGGALTGTELDDTRVCEAATAERILLHNRLNLRSTRPDREDDSTIPEILRPETRKWPAA